MTSQGKLVDPNNMTDDAAVRWFQDYNHRRQEQMTQEALEKAPERFLNAVGFKNPWPDSNGPYHILFGDSYTSGGHRYGLNNYRESEFPSYWTDEMILKAIYEVYQMRSPLIKLD